MVSTDEGNEVFIALLRVQKMLVAARTTAPKVHAGLDATAYPVFFAIAGSGHSRVSDIAALLHNDVSTVSRQVSTFVMHGLVAKETDPHDGRAQVVSLTDEGREVLHELQRSRATWFQSLLEGWTSDEIAQFVRHLRCLGDALDAHLRTTGAPSPLLLSDHLRKDRHV